MKSTSRITSIVIFLALAFLQACAFVYEQDVQQGNVVTDEMLDNLELGMSKAETQYHLGTPLIEDPFHANRWDYFYTLKLGREDEREQRVITIWFDDNERLAEIRGDAETLVTEATEITLPDEGELNTIATNPEQKTSLWRRVKSKILGQ